MKGTHRKIRIGLVAALAPLALFPAFTSCSEGSEMEVVNTGERVSVRIGAKAGGMTDIVSTRSYNDDYNAEEGEFINSLCILVINVDYDEYWDVSGFTLETKIEPDLSDDPDAQKGNLASWYSLFDITAGYKILLAFANWENVVNLEDESDGWAKLLNMKEGDSFTATTYDGLTAELSILVDDPASKVDIANGKYIPMSGIMDAYFWHNGYLDEAYIPLERLVAKVTLSGQIVDYTDTEGTDYTGENAVTYTCTGGTLSETNDKVWLFHYYYDDFYFADDTYPRSADDYVGTATLSLATNPTITTNGGTANLGTFYVNETVLTQYASHFNLHWGLSGTDGKNLNFVANTNAGVLQRNSVMPLAFSWDYDYTGVVVNAWVELTGEEIYYDPSNQSSGGNYY